MFGLDAVALDSFRFGVHALSELRRCIADRAIVGLERQVSAWLAQRAAASYWRGRSRADHEGSLHKLDKAALALLRLVQEHAPLVDALGLIATLAKGGGPLLAEQSGDRPGPGASARWAGELRALRRDIAAALPAADGSAGRAWIAQAEPGDRTDLGELHTLASITLWELWRHSVPITTGEDSPACRVLAVVLQEACVKGDPRKQVLRWKRKHTAQSQVKAAHTGKSRRIG